MGLPHMSLDPLLSAPLVVQFHAILALSAVALTIAIFSLRKGSRLHRVFGWTWVILMGAVALSSFWIGELRWIGPFGPIHILSVFTLVSLIRGVRAARSHRVADHRAEMRSLTFGALILAGAFTFFPGRIMFLVVSGG